MPFAMKRFLALILVLASAAALAQEGRRRPHEPGPRWQRSMQAPLAPHGGMSWEERQRLRDELKSGRRDDFGRRPQFDPRRQPPPMAPEDRERLRRDLRDANRELGRRR